MNKKRRQLVFLFEPYFVIKILHVTEEELAIYKQDMVSYDHDAKRDWLHWYYLGEL